MKLQKPIAKARPRPNSTAMATFLFLLSLQHRNRTIISVFKCQRILLDYLTEQSITTISLRSARKRSSSMCLICEQFDCVEKRGDTQSFRDSRNLTRGQEDLSQPRIAPYKSTSTSSKYSILVLELAQERGLRFYQTRSHAVVLCDTLPAEFIEKAVWKTTDQLYQKESSTKITTCCAQS